MSEVPLYLAFGRAAVLPREPHHVDPLVHLQVTSSTMVPTMVQDSGCKLHGSGSRTQGSGFRVEGQGSKGEVVRLTRDLLSPKTGQNDGASPRCCSLGRLVESRLFPGQNPLKFSYFLGQFVASFVGGGC